MNDKLIPLSHFKELPKGSAGFDVLRYVSMPNFLGDEKDTILYFIGRHLSRQITIEKMEDIYYLFDTFRWGSLELVKDRRRTLTFHLMSDDLAQRMESPFEIDYRLEAGFLAESIETITERACECTETINKRLYRVQFKIVFTDD